MRPPTVMSCAGCRNRFTPTSLAICGRSRLMICVAVAVRCSCGLRPTKNRAVLSVLPLPEPKNEPTAATSGSFARTPATSRCSRFISVGETSCAASMMPIIRPLSWVGKKPFGMITNRNAVSAMVAQHEVEPALVAVHQRVEHALDRQVDAAVVLALALEEARGEHRRQRQRDQHRDRDRGGHGERELAEQAPDDAAHQ